jgi:hypothetical protein
MVLRGVVSSTSCKIKHVLNLLYSVLLISTMSSMDAPPPPSIPTLADGQRVPTNFCL